MYLLIQVMQLFKFFFSFLVGSLLLWYIIIDGSAYMQSPVMFKIWVGKGDLHIRGTNYTTLSQIRLDFTRAHKYECICALGCDTMFSQVRLFYKSS